MDRRRSWMHRGRRLSHALSATLATGAVAASTAAADQPVVSATIYPGSTGSVSSREATLAQLQACPLYSGPNPMYLYPGQQPYQAPGGSTWTVDQVLQCGLGIPSGQVSAVQVQTGTRYEAPLSSAALTDPGQYHDASAPGALPIISSDGADNQNTYVRPYRGGSDDNAGDEVVQAGAPVALLVYLNGSLLTVTATQQTVSKSSKAKVVRLAATARDATGAPVPASALTWSWSFGDGHGSTAPMPTHAFTAGVYSVSVQVTDSAAGSGGTAALRVAFSPSTGTGRDQTGGPKPTKSKSPTGSDHGTHKNGTGTHSPAGNGASSGNQHPTASTSPGATTTPTTTTPTAAATTTTTTTTTATTMTTATTTATTPPTSTTAPAPRSRTPHRRNANPPRAPQGTEVSGQLISDVAPVPAASSPLVHLTPAAAAPEAAVRQASHLSAAPAVGAALAVGLLLALGAGRELRGRRRGLDGGN
jgi:hypothetical protein